MARAHKLSVEMAARNARHDFLARTAARLGIRSIALAHHADDQIELFFLRLLRGSGGEGLGGMKWRNPSPSGVGIELVRPLLDQPKAVLVEYAGAQGIRYREDASNAVLDFQRNRIRHELLPLLRGKYQPALDRTIPRVMDIVGADAEFAIQAAREWLERGGRPKPEGRRPKETRRSKAERGRVSARVALQAPDRGQVGLSFEQLPVAVQRRCVQLQLFELGIVPDYELVEQLRTTAERPVALSRAQVADVRGASGSPVLLYAVRDRSGLVEFQSAEPETFNAGAAGVELKGRAGELEFGGTRIWWRINSRKAAEQPKPGVRRECFDAVKVGTQVLLRHWRPGDRFQPIGMASPVKLQDFFTNQKVPRDRRRQLLLAVTAKDELFWVEGMRISERFKLTKQTIRCLQWRWQQL
jgi:tRNA(Ile)-lysidine synthase